ncbi:hypothetical protein VTP01DRAFT_3298 [Rhizomucor pusillus]|uniref:uncharacterized protein n=1 Tax=Rhizomucor pusillus TaxID=4840 RepID=UPI0037443BE1
MTTFSSGFFRHSVTGATTSINLLLFYKLLLERTPQRLNPFLEQLRGCLQTPIHINTLVCPPSRLTTLFRLRSHRSRKSPNSISKKRFSKLAMHSGVPPAPPPNN